MIVPALPGSCTSSSTTTSRAPGGTASRSRTGACRATATTPCGVRGSAIAARASSLASSTSTPAASAAAASSGNRPNASEVKNTSVTLSGACASTSRTTCGPSNSASPVSDRALFCLRPATRLTAALRGLSITSSGRGGGDRRRRVGGQGRLRRGDEARERGGLVHRQLREDAAVHLDPGEAETLDEAVVREAVRAGRGVDPLDPEATEVALALTAVAVRVDEGVGDLLLRLAVEAGPLAAVPLGALEDYPTLLVRIDGALDPGHDCSPAGVERGRGLLAEQLLDVLAVGVRQHGLLVEAAGAHARLALEVVAHAGLLLHDLAAAGDLEALLGAGMGLLLRHYCSLGAAGAAGSVSASADAGVLAGAGRGVLSALP